MRRHGNFSLTCAILLITSLSLPSLATAAIHSNVAELILAIGGERTEGYDPTLGWGRYGSPLFQSTLLKRDAKLNIIGDLALTRELSEDKKVWKVSLRKDVRFSDKTPLTAEDVVYTFNTAAKSGGKVDLTLLDRAEVVDTHTVRFHLKKPQVTFIQRMITLGIVPKHLHGPDYGRNPVGSGPFTLVQWNEGQQMVVTANPLYYGNKPAFEKITFLFVNEDTAFAAAKAGKVHMAAVPQTFAVQKINGMHLHAVSSVDNRGIMFPALPKQNKKSSEGYPIGNDVTADKAIRRAINYAIDRKALVAGILENYGSPAYGVVDGLPWDQKSGHIIDNDLEKAEKILKDAGWRDTDQDGVVEKDGLKAEFTLVYPANDSIRQALALASADMAAQVGIRIEILGKSWDDIPQYKHSNAILFGWGSHDPTEMYNLYYSKKAGQEYFNCGFYANKTVDNHLDAAMTASTFEDSLPHWQAAQWDGETGFMPPGDAAWAWLVNLTHTYFVNDCLNIGDSQMEPHGHGWPITANIETWKWGCP